MIVSNLLWKTFIKLPLAVLIIMLFFGVQPLKAQSDSSNNLKTYHIGIFAPLYLDSIFDAAGNFRYKGIPKYAAPGIEFIHGAETALDSMELPDANVTANIYDSKSYNEPVSFLVENKKLDKLDIIIGSVKDADYRQLADFALQKNIPFISATYPNDGGITNNPYVVIVNPTLKVHCEAIYSYLLQSHGSDKIFLVRKKGTQEDKIAGYFKVLNEQDGKPLLNMQTINFENTNADFLIKKLDSTKRSIIVGMSLSEDFANNLSLACSDLHKNFPITLIGMPNWDAFKALTKKDGFSDFPIYFTSPYFNTKEDMYSKVVLSNYSEKYKGKPTDMVFKGFECTMLFTKLLAKHSTSLMKNLNDKSIRIFSEYNFRPVATTRNGITNYIENKHLYFIKLLNGTTSKAW